MTGRWLGWFVAAVAVAASVALPVPAQASADGQGRAAGDARPVPHRRVVAPPRPTLTIFDTTNPALPANGPTDYALFDIDRPLLVTRLTTMHWNFGRGASPGLVGLYGSDGEYYGPFLSEGLPGPQGISDVYWYSEPYIILQPGQYVVFVSEPESWSQNDASSGVGFVRIEGAWW
ncbi:MAG: hypothetical protein KJZ85_12910 [Rhodobacteraceae bacterium]|jgi:hypothetical protein|nr:hypothetical protein [Paracoccaceae bacterium]